MEYQNFRAEQGLVNMLSIVKAVLYLWSDSAKATPASLGNEIAFSNTQNTVYKNLNKAAFSAGTCPTRRREYPEKIMPSTVILLLMVTISILNVANPFQMAPDPHHMPKIIMKGCLCLKGKRKHYSVQSMYRDRGQRRTPTLDVHTYLGKHYPIPPTEISAEG